MLIYDNPDPRQRLCEGCVVTIGNFDGVHNGHREIFRRMKAFSAATGCRTVVVTFSPHPLAVLAPEMAPQMITTPEQKARLIATEGIDLLVTIDFTPEFAHTGAEDFVRQYLVHMLCMRHIIIGHDYAFGSGRQGNYETLARIGAECGYGTEDTDPVGRGGHIFSSSLVRRMVAEGDMPGARIILGRDHFISGTVVPGFKRGKALGFPTANIATPNQLIPPNGVYAVRVELNGRRFGGACSIGTNPTFDGHGRTIEVFILDFDEDIYGETVTVSFVRMLRGEKRFSGIDELKAAIAADVAMVREILAADDPGVPS